MEGNVLVACVTSWRRVPVWPNGDGEEESEERICDPEFTACGNLRYRYQDHPYE